MSRWMDGCVYGWMNGWMSRWMDGGVNGCMDDYKILLLNS